MSVSNNDAAAAERILNTRRVFCISMARGTAWKNVEARIAVAGFPSVLRWDAIVGKQLPGADIKGLVSLRARAELGSERHTHEQLGSLGAVGCYLSHLAIWRQIVRDEIPRTVVFEDDVVFPPQFLANLEAATAQLPLADLHTFFFGYSNLRDGDAHFFSECYGGAIRPLVCRYTGRFWGTHSYLLTLQGARILLAQALPIEVQVDAYMSSLGPSMRSFFCRRSLTLQRRAGSSIQTLALRTWMPANNWFYVGLMLLLLVLAAAAVCFVSRRIRARQTTSTSEAHRYDDLSLVLSPTSPCCESAKRSF